MLIIFNGSFSNISASSLTPSTVRSNVNVAREGCMVIFICTPLIAVLRIMLML